MSDNSIKCYPSPLLNKKIYAMGLNPTQLIVLFFLIAIGMLASFILGAIMIVPVYFIGQKINKENKNGNPDYFKSLIRNMGKTKQLEDPEHCLKYLLKDGK